MRVCVCVCVCVRACVYLHTRSRACVCASVCASGVNVFVRVCMRGRKSVYLSARVCIYAFFMHVRLVAPLHLWWYAYICARVCPSFGACVFEKPLLCVHARTCVRALLCIECLHVIMRVDARVFAHESMLVEGAALCIFTCVDFTERVE